MIRKRFLPLLLALFLLLSACGGRSQDVTDQSCKTILQVMLADAPEGEQTDQLEWFVNADDIESYLTDRYDLADTNWHDAAIVCMNAARAFELAVLMVDESDVDTVTEHLQSYLQTRLAAFTGYAPDQAALVENALILTKGDRVALIVSEDTDAMESAFASCFGGGVNATGVPEVLQPSTLPNGRVVYTAPNIDDMTLYDTSAILSAWTSGDPSSLSDYDRTIYDKASAVLFELLADNMTDYQQERAIYKWVVTNVEYDYTHYIDPAQLSPDSSTPYGPLVNGAGICLGFSTTFQLLMDMADLECITVVGASFDSQEDHAWNQVRLNGEWYCVDSTWDTGIDDPDQWNYFNVTSDHMADTDHQWDYDAVPEATATDHGNPFS
jgi:hypothetical protein